MTLQEAQAPAATPSLRFPPPSVPKKRQARKTWDPIRSRYDPTERNIPASWRPIGAPPSFKDTRGVDAARAVEQCERPHVWLFGEGYDWGFEHGVFRKEQGVARQIPAHRQEYTRHPEYFASSHTVVQGFDPPACHRALASADRGVSCARKSEGRCTLQNHFGIRIAARAE
ncbi:hypothetical protein BJV78DRAFT_1156260 [Lactifluus subvellereus]|nr:hypothetical protein BJV78DRAFT_1156260 [Lactifluus subvellereus]